MKQTCGSSLFLYRTYTSRVTSYGRDNISVFAKLHNFLISERLLMYLEAPSLTTAAVGHKMHNVIFLLPRPISTPTLNGSEGKQIQKSIFPRQETCLGFFWEVNLLSRQETTKLLLLESPPPLVKIKRSSQVV